MDHYKTLTIAADQSLRLFLRIKLSLVSVSRMCVLLKHQYLVRITISRSFDFYLDRLRQEVRDGGGAEGPGERRHR